ncbi:MAG TPA: hypothetical protein DCQ64_09500 [Candidatus Rokubacteria bacterium]|nr:hypothetical protein [Candidatus Rokubacteria bacterium]
MKPRRPYTLLLVASVPPKHVTDLRVIASNPRRAVRKVLKQLVGVEAVHVLLDGRRVRTMEFGK